MSIPVALSIHTTVYLAIVTAGYLRTRDALHPVVVGPSVYYYWTAGNVFLELLGYDAGAGTRLEYTADALQIFTVAMIAFAAPMLLGRPRDLGGRRVLTTPPPGATWIVTTLSVVLSLSNAIVYLTIVPGLDVTASKIHVLPDLSIAPFIHYNYLLAWLALGSTIFAVFGHRFWRVSMVVNVNCGLYLLYSWMTYERDYLLFGLVYLVSRRLEGRSVALRTGVVLTLVAVMFVGVSLYRSSHVVGLDPVEAALGQGSNLHVMTNVLAWMDAGLPTRGGQSYLDAVVRTILPLRENAPPLANWFRDEYAPTVSTGGYGFGLEAEAYLNWRMPGVIGVFVLLGAGVAAVDRLNRSGSVFWRFVYLYGYVILLYAIRGESLMILKAMTYGAAMFVAILVVAGRGSVYFRQVEPRVAGG